uniref:Uncharacterized protein n=1 Tax=Plectus sambesii TaxID=2011161 RepID=A0A914UVL1_9BILA
MPIARTIPTRQRPPKKIGDVKSSDLA